MKHIRRILMGILCLCLVTGIAVFSARPVSAEESDIGTPVLTGNTGAVLSCNTVPLSTEIDSNDLAVVEIRGNEVRVIGKEDAVGVARLTVETADGYHVWDIPIGYTTFVFNGSRLTVIPGSSSNYEISGINSADEEYLVGDASYPLPVSYDENGNQVFENTDSYKLCVGLKKAGGTYVFTGTGTDSCIAVKKAATAPSVILLAGLDLTSSFTAPITVKKESASTAAITALAGFTNTLTDNPFNNADLYGDPTEDGGDGTNTAYAESAVIKGKSYANLTLNGEGTLNLVCSTKNAVKVGEYGSLTVDGPTLNVTSAKNGLSSDNTLVIQSGNINVTTADGDCIRTDPDAVNAEAGCAADIVINGGVFQLQSGSDGIQSAQNLTINGGDFTIRTLTGYNDSTFNKDTMSCKGIKGTNPSEDETAEGTNIVTINGGTFDLNTADDAIHSDGSIVITGGDFVIRTGDDGVHADVQADFGSENAGDCRIHMTVSACYEGLEASNVYIHSGCYDITASDDGINAAGGSSSGSDPWPGGDPWNPGGGGGDYELTISGGLVNVNAGGDGLDSNGSETLSGGSIIVWGAGSSGSGSDNAPLDCDGTLRVNGATVFAAGSRQMAETPGSGSQPFVRFGSSGGWGGGGSSIASGRTVAVKNASGQTVFSVKAPKTVNFALYSSPDMTSSSGWSITSDTSTPLVTRFWAEHNYGEFVQTAAPSCTVPGEATAVCPVCGLTETEPVAPTGHVWSFVTVAPTLAEEGYDLYTCSVCGGQYRTNFTDPTGCPDGNHSWGEGVVIREAGCTEDGEMLFTCSVCGAEKHETIPAPGHDYDNETGICHRCGLEACKAVFVCSDGCSVTVYRTKDLTADGTEQAASAFPRDGDTGLIDVSGSGQINFVVVLEDACRLESVTAEPADHYKNLKADLNADVPHSYRITKMTDSVTVTVIAADHEWNAPVWTWTETEDGFTATATFTCAHDAAHVQTLPAEVTCTEAADGSLVYTAAVTGPDGEQYTDEKTVERFTVTFENYDGTVLQTGYYKAGEMPVYEGETPVKEDALYHHYTFTGWDKEIAAVTENTVYTAVLEDQLYALVKGMSLELEGKLGIRLRAGVPEEAAKAVLEFGGEFPETIETELVRDAAHGYNSEADEFTLIYGKIAAKEMTCPLTLKIYDAEGNELPLEQSTMIGTADGTVYTTCLADWAAYAAENASAENTVNLAKSILNYGGAAQAYFKFNTENPANPLGYLADETAEVTADSALDRVIPANAKSQLGFLNMALNLEGDTELQIKFSRKVTAVCNGKALTVKKTGSMYVVSIPGIAAVDLDEMYSVQVTYGSSTLTFKAAALSWCNAALGASTKEDLITLCKALYVYNKMAEIYFNKVD